MAKNSFVFLFALGISIIIAFPILSLCKKFHFSQTILHYVDKHSLKNGTPTMGGVIFIAACLLTSLPFLKSDGYVSLLLLFTMLGFSLLGFLDDFIKIKYHKNEGLKPYQKIIGQVGLSLVIAIFVYFKIGSELDFFGLKLNLGIFIIPFIVLFYVAVTNSVNLLDGLDGLASGVSATYLVCFSIIILMLNLNSNFSIIGFAMVGALVGFILFNCYPAKIFMGDTGSLGLGGLIASLAVFTKLELILPIIGILFVITALSDILQVAYYKNTHKRIFKMAPLHHHFEKLGVNENRIVAIYIVITIFTGIVSILGYGFATGVL